MQLLPTFTPQLSLNLKCFTIKNSRSIRSGLDFGNYSCVAENSLGTFKQEFILINIIIIIINNQFKVSKHLANRKQKNQIYVKMTAISEKSEGRGQKLGQTNLQTLGSWKKSSKFVGNQKNSNLQEIRNSFSLRDRQNAQHFIFLGGFNPPGRNCPKIK